MFHLKKSAKDIGGIILTTTRLSRQLRRSNCLINSRTFCSPTGITKDEQGNVFDAPTVKVSGFAKSFEKQSQIADPQDNEQNHTFASLLRNSKLMDVS